MNHHSNNLALCVFSVLSVTLWLTSSSSAASPSLGSITPRGAQRGKEVELSFSGARLADAKEILFYSKGFTVSKLQAVNAGLVKATVKIAADCKLGEHTMRVRTEGGISEMRTFWVGALPIVAEKEPNSDFKTPQKISLNVTVTGTVDYEDVDYYAVECKKGQRLSVEVEGMRLANTLFDPAIAILDSKRFELASSDDTPLLGQDGFCSIVAPADGTYIIQVRESAYQGNGACGYRLHVGTFPRPTAIFPAGGKAGEEIEVRFLGDPRGEIKQKIKLPTDTDQIELFCQDGDGISPSPIKFRVSPVGNLNEVEPNDTHATATKGDFPLACNGIISKAGDVDCFTFKAKKGQTFDVHCFARRLGSPLDPVMTFSYAKGGAIAYSDDAIGPDSYFRVTIPADAEYVLTITDHLGKGGPTYNYRVEFNAVVPTATVSIPKVALYSQERQSISVPKGGRMATLVAVSRANFGGELKITGEGLPAGVTLANENMASNLDIVPVVFEAKGDAAVAGTLGTLSASHIDPKHPKVKSSFFQMAEMIVGGPGQSVYWRTNVDRLAVAVTEEAPFSIEIVEPKVPLVQNGSMQLKIIAKRKPGFKGAITVYPLFNPPGVGSVTSAVIPADKTETFMQLNANGGAQIRKWKTAVLGLGDAGKGPVWTSSQLATLEVAAPLVTFTMEKTAAEQGKNVELFCKVAQLTAFEGKAKVKLLGLPFKASAPEVEITKDTKEVTFKIVTDKATPAGIHRNLFCQVIVTKNSEAITANTGYSELRIDVPIVKTTPPKTTTPVVTPKPTPNQPVKRLTRLEKLRLEQEEREKAGKK